MKKLFAFTLLQLGTAMLAASGTFHGQWIVRDASSNAVKFSSFTIQPISTYGTSTSNTITGDRKTFRTDSDGRVTVSNLFNGRSYRVQITGPNFTTTFTNSFDTNVTGLVNGADYISAPIRDAGLVAYSQTQADARFLRTNISHIVRPGDNITITTNGAGPSQYLTISASGGGGGSSTFYPGQSTTWRTLGGSNVVDVTGTLTNSTTGNAATATLATNASTATNLAAAGSFGVVSNYAGIVTPRMFGAVADGETDDSAAFQAAIAAKNRLQWTIDLEGLTYRINQTIDLQSNFVSVVNGAISVTNATLKAISLSGANTTLSDLQLYGPNVNVASGSVGVIITNRPYDPYLASTFAAAHVTVQRCRIQGFDVGLHVARATHPTVEDCEFLGNKTYSIWVNGSDMGRYLKNFCGVASTPTGGGSTLFPDTFFPTNTLPQWISNSVAIRVEGHNIVNFFDRNSGGQCKRAMEVLDAQGIEIAGSEIEDVYDYGALRTVMYFSNVTYVTIRQSLFIRIYPSLPTAFGYTFVNCPGNSIYIEPGNNYDGTTPLIAWSNSLAWPASMLPRFFQNTTVRTLDSLTAMTGTDKYHEYGTLVSPQGSYAWSAAQYFGAETRFTNNSSVYLAPTFITVGSDAGNQTTKTANTNKRQYFRAPRYADSGDTDSVIWGEYISASSGNFLRLGGNSFPAAGLTDLIFSLGSSVSANTADRATMTYNDFSPASSGGMTLGAVQPWGKTYVTMNPLPALTTVSLTADNQAVSVAGVSYLRLSSDNATASNRTFTLSGGEDRQTLVIVWLGVNAGELADGGPPYLNGIWTPGDWDTLTLFCVGGNWVETARSNN